MGRKCCVANCKGNYDQSKKFIDHQELRRKKKMAHYSGADAEILMRSMLATMVDRRRKPK